VLTFRRFHGRPSGSRAEADPDPTCPVPHAAAAVRDGTASRADGQAADGEIRRSEPVELATPGHGVDWFTPGVLNDVLQPAPEESEPTLQLGFR
jgi:hypothetical protein